MSHETSKVRRIFNIGGMEIVHATYHNVIFPRHYHDRASLAVMMRGAQRLTYGGTSEPVQAGSLIAFNPGEVHANTILESDGWTCFSLYMSQHTLTHLLAGDEARHDRPPVFRTPVIQDRGVFQALLQFHHAVSTTSLQLEIDTLLLTALEPIVERYTETTKPVSRSSQAPHAIMRVRDYLNTHYAQSISLAEVAQVAGMRPSSVNRAFRRHTGLPPHEYLINRRVAQACSRLDQGQTLVDVALSTGFYDQSHFSRHFRRIMGMTPAQYQQVK